jgi:hypothetical protein
MRRGDGHENDGADLDVSRWCVPGGNTVLPSGWRVGHICVRYLTCR